MEISVAFPHRSVYISGERVSARIQFQLRRPSPSSPPQCLAWASVQIECECITDDKNVAQTASSSTAEHRLTSFRPGDWLEGSQVMSSSPKLLFCELILDHNEPRREFDYQEAIPAEAPPTYRGKNIRFRYNLLIATQRLNSKVEVLKVPFRVLCGGGNASSNGRIDVTLGGADVNNGREEQISVTNPFAKSRGGGPSSEVGVPSPKQMTLHMASKKMTSYEIANSQGKIASLCFFRNEYKLGETIVASFDFSVGEVECLQYTCCLVCEEEIFGGGADDGGRKALIRHGKTNEFCLGVDQTTLNLEIPLHVTPTFISSQCTLNWVLQFEFVITKESVLKSGDGVGEWNGPKDVGVQTLVWNLPIKIFSCDPFQVELSLKNKVHVKYNLAAATAASASAAAAAAT